ncbi:MAG TPA: Gfo/Idh/MocA family oxidoreductase [Sedimentisphaerales bacterium]|nr:Gfo/Idh/MocA family oxidoreductase [Sedimentisphaerales bacterium]
MKTPISRRDFVRRSVVAGLSLAVPFTKVRGANDAVRVAVVGIRSQGRNHINWFRKIPGVRVVAICDADKSFLDREVKSFAERNEKVDTYVDYRKLLDDRNIDAVITATPNHWHALATVWACQAGKDVYVEKPVSHNIWEGRQMVEAVRKYNRIVQSGTQRRSDQGLREALEYIRQGSLGKITLIRGFVYVRRDSIGKVEGPQPVPESVDYNLWCGPAPVMPLMRKTLHYDWHWTWPTGDGDFGNNGIHYIDLCRWFAGKRELAPRVLGLGGRFGYIDDGQTPNTMIVFYDYKPAPILFEVRGLPRAKGESAMDNLRGVNDGGVIVECENGYFAGGWAYDKDGKKIRQFRLTEGAGHHENFIQAVRSRKVSDLNADVLEGHLSSALCHMGNISYRLGKEAARPEIVARLEDNSDLAESFERFQEHLLVNGVDVKQTPRVLGPWLTMDPQMERFTGEFAEQANVLARGTYREPFIVPEQV